MNRYLNIVIPVKNPARAKERMKDVLIQEQRTALALCLFEEVLRFFQEIFQALENPPHLLVVTDSRDIAGLAERYGATALLEEKAEGETRAVERAAAWSTAEGFRSQLVIPGDMACLGRDDVLRLIQHPRPAPSVVLSPAVGEDGTNAVMFTPPDVIKYRFGARSFPDYQSRAETAGVPCEVLRLSSLVLDLDTPEDLAAFMREQPGHPAMALLRTWNIPTPSN